MGFGPLPPLPPPGWRGPGTVYGAPPGTGPPQRNNSIVPIVALIAVVVLLVAAVPAYLLFMRDDGEGGASSTILADTSTTRAGSATRSTLAPGATVSTAVTAGSARTATAFEALKTQLPEGWISKLVEDGQTSKTYWAGPLNSEWATVYVVTQSRGRGWAVTDSSPFQGGSDVPATDEEQARYVVEDFLLAVQEDRPEDAHALTIQPFSLDGASAGYSNGDFLSFTIDGVDAVGDGTYWVNTTEVWRYDTDTWRYRVVSTEAGWRIQDLEHR